MRMRRGPTEVPPLLLQVCPDLDGERFYLCTAASKLSESNCELSDDFSAYYNAPVYTCIA